jgi:hypothetical protein
MRRAVLVCGSVLLGIAGVGYALGQVARNHADAAGGSSANTSSSTAGSAPPAVVLADHHPGMGTLRNEGPPHDIAECEVGTTGMRAFAALHGALRRPLVRNLFDTFLLPQMQVDLGLSADQMLQLQQVREELLVKGDSFTRQIAAKQKELDALLAPDTSKGQQVKSLLGQIADLEAQEQYAVYGAARKTKAVLREDQRNRLESMKPEELNRAVMERLTLGDLTQAMQFLPAGL